MRQQTLVQQDLQRLEQWLEKAIVATRSATTARTEGVVTEARLT